MTRFDYDLTKDTAPAMGLIALQSDERIELDFRRLIPPRERIFVSRVPSARAVTPQSLADMAGHIPTAAALLPGGLRYAVVGYGCTSASAQIGTARVHDLVRREVDTGAVSDPLSALVAACGELGVSRLGFLSPYVETVSSRLRDALRARGIETPVFGSFEEAEERKVVHIAAHSIARAAQDLAGQGGVDALFLSCTNLDTLDIIAPLRAATGLAVLSSNLVLGWHMCRLAGITPRLHLTGETGK